MEPDIAFARSGFDRCSGSVFNDAEFPCFITKEVYFLVQTMASPVSSIISLTGKGRDCYRPKLGGHYKVAGPAKHSPTNSLLSPPFTNSLPNSGFLPTTV